MSLFTKIFSETALIMGLPKMKAEHSIAGVVTGAVRVWLRTESLAAFVLSALLYARLGQKWWIFAALFLAPDLPCSATYSTQKSAPPATT